jgi:cytochrome c oxidase subunit 2
MAPTSHRPRSPSPRHRVPALVAGLAAAAAVVVVAGCGGSDSGPALTGAAAQGKQVARDRGCTSCHTADGSRSEGPTWKGVAGSTVRLADGTSVVADDAYLARSIRDPRAQILQGYRATMPVANGITDAEVAALTAYIKALA